jgi:hypothetical protein
MVGRVVFGEIVRGIVAARGPVEVELFLLDSVKEPMPSHIEGFRFFQSDFGMKNTVGCGVVCFEWNATGWLRMPHFRQGGNDRHSFLCIEEQSSYFGFGSRGRNGANGFAEDMNGAVGFGTWGVTDGTRKIGEEEMSGRPTASIW